MMDIHTAREGNNLEPRDGGLLAPRVLVFAESLRAEDALGRATRAVTTELERVGIETAQALDAMDAAAILESDPSIDAALIELDGRGAGGVGVPGDLLSRARTQNHRRPIFLLAEQQDLSSLPLTAIRAADDFIWLLEDTPDFIAGRVAAAVRRYRNTMLPPLFSALVNFATTHEYSWHTPGHTGGTAFLRSPVGRAFYEFFGETLFRSDLSISVAELGSLLDHSGPIADAEAYAARVFGADRTYSVTNGTSTSNRIVISATVTPGDVVLCDRNCHKSIEQGLTLTGGLPIYLVPTRNRYGIIGPIPRDGLDPDAVASSLASRSLAGAHEATPVLAVVTNSTYDGLCYDASEVLARLGRSVDRIHFDEAWYAYARFHPMYRGRFAMSDGRVDRQGPTVFATQSTHKLLAALSQASFIHVRDGRQPVEHERFNAAFMMHSSTSPQYAIIASNDVSAAMMDGPAGTALIGASIHEAVTFRQTIARIDAELAASDDWFFRAWQPPTVTDPESGQEWPFAEAPEHLLTDGPSAWVLRPGAAWHGFADLTDGYCLLDPIKVTLLTPGVADDGTIAAERAVPAALVTAYLDTQGIVVEKTGDFTILFLFSMGVTKGKWGTLITALLDFKDQYDRNAPLEDVLPRLVADHPDTYAGLGLRDLATRMAASMREHDMPAVLDAAFSALPEPAMPPAAAYQHLVRGRVEPVSLAEMAHRVTAVGVVPYPPGIPMLMPGERVGGADGPWLRYLTALEAFDLEFPAFGHDIHGVSVVDGRYQIECVCE